MLFCVRILAIFLGSILKIEAGMNCMVLPQLSVEKNNLLFVCCDGFRGLLMPIASDLPLSLDRVHWNRAIFRK